MTNGEKYKTAKERSDALNMFCETITSDCCGCPLQKDGIDCQFTWLELEAEEEKPMPCPFCGGETRTNSNDDEFYVECFDPSKPFSKSSCGYIGTYKKTGAEAIAAHNRVCKAVAAYKKSEVK